MSNHRQNRDTSANDLKFVNWQARKGDDMQSNAQSNQLPTKRCGNFSDEVAAVLAAALIACIPRSEAREFTLAEEFLAQSLQGLESKIALHEGYALERVAHAFRAPLGTLRLAIRVGFIRLESGDTLDTKILRNALVQVQQRIERITEPLACCNDAMSDRHLSP